MEAATLTAAGKVLTTIIKAGSTISEISDFWSVFSSIKDTLDNHKGISSVIDNAVNKAWGKSGRTNYLGMRPSNSQLIELVIKKYRKESFEIPNNWFRDDEFERFYDILIDERSFWNIFMELFQNYENSRQKETLEGIRESTNVIKEDVEKTKLPKWLISYDVELSTNSKTVFLQDAHENLIRENKIYRKKDTIETITNWLDTKGACLIIAPEGRGKTFLSRIIAFDYHENNTMVYFADCRNESKPFYDDIKSLLFNWNNDKDKENLLILENIHACTDLERLKQYIENQIRHEEIATNIKFLLNARPTIVDYNYFMNWEETIYLQPNENDVQEIVNLYKTVTNRNPFESEEKMMTFIKIISPNENDSNGANLRLLSIYLRTWQNNSKIRYVSDVTEEDIYGDFITTYKLDVSLDRDTVLLFISSLFQFDVPVHPKAIKQFLKNEGINFNLLEDLVKEGLLIKSRNLYYLPHSVEAYFLFKAICYKQKENYIDKTEEFVRFFIDDFILKQNKPREFEGDLRLLQSGLFARDEEFRKIIQYITSEDKAMEIITKLNPGFVVPFFHNNHDSDALKLYKDNIVLFKLSILELSPLGFRIICYYFDKNFQYSIIKDVFENPLDLYNYLHQLKIHDHTSLTRIFGKDIIREINCISPEHVEVLREFRYHVELHKTKLYCFVSIEKKDSQILISSIMVHNEYRLYDKVRFRELISDICSYGFYFDKLTWRQLIVFLRKMVDCFIETHKDSFLQVINNIVKMVIDNEFLVVPNAISRISYHNLSSFLICVNHLDNNLYNNTISNTKIIETVKHRFDKLDSITSNDLYLFSRFYSQPWCKTRMNSLIDNANEEQLSIVKEWHDKVLEGIQKEEKTMEPESMLAYIHKKYYSIDNQNIVLGNALAIV